MKNLCLLVVLVLVCVIMDTSSAEDNPCDDSTSEERLEALRNEPWEGIWHTHDDSPHDGISGEHFHATHRDVNIGGCVAAQTTGYKTHGTPGTGAVGDRDLTDDTDKDTEPLPEQQPTEWRDAQVPPIRPSTRPPEEPTIQDSPDSGTTPEPERDAPESQQQTRETPEPHIDSDILEEIATGERPPVEVTDPQTGETTVIDATTAKARLDGNEGTLSPEKNEIVYQPPDVVVTEYMMTATGAGLPQWIEIYNREDRPVVLNGWTMKVWNHRDRERTITFSRWVYIPKKGFLILVNKDLDAGGFGGINTKRVRVHSLKELGKYRWIKRFHLYDAQGNLIENGDQYEAERPELKEGRRSSYDVVNKKNTGWHKNKAWIGSPDDRSTLGWHKFPEEAPAAPRLNKKKTLSWASLKRKGN